MNEVSRYSTGLRRARGSSARNSITAGCIGNARRGGGALGGQFLDDRPAGDDDRQKEDDAEQSLELKIEIQKQSNDHREDQHDRHRDERLDGVADQQFDEVGVGEQGAGVVCPLDEVQS